MTSRTIYDYPLYYDILFGWNRGFECDFYDRCFRRHGVELEEGILEVACGPGRVALLLARIGWRVTGLDLNSAMLTFLEARSVALGLEVETLCGDMESFVCESPFAAAFNPMSSIRLLETDAQAEAHLHRMASNLRPGGIYVLDLEFADSEEKPDLTTEENWEMTRDGITVAATNQAVYVNDRGTHRVLTWGNGVHLRSYTPRAFVERVNAADGFRIEAWYPEASRETGISEFAREPSAEMPQVGRGMLLLRKCP